MKIRSFCGNNFRFLRFKRKLQLLYYLSFYCSTTDPFRKRRSFCAFAGWASANLRTPLLISAVGVRKFEEGLSSLGSFPQLFHICSTPLLKTPGSISRVWTEKFLRFLD